MQIGSHLKLLSSCRKTAKDSICIVIKSAGLNVENACSRRIPELQSISCICSCKWPPSNYLALQSCWGLNLFCASTGEACLLGWLYLLRLFRHAADHGLPLCCSVCGKALFSTISRGPPNRSICWLLRDLFHLMTDLPNIQKCKKQCMSVFLML